MADPEAPSNNSVTKKIQNVAHKIQFKAQEKISEFESKGDIRQLDVKKAMPVLYEEFVKATASYLRDKYDPSMKDKTISLSFPLPCDKTCVMQIHVGGGIKKPSILLQLGAEL